MSDDEIIAQIKDDMAELERRLALWRGTRIGLEGLHAAAADRTIRSLLDQIQNLELALDEVANA